MGTIDIRREQSGNAKSGFQWTISYLKKLSWLLLIREPLATSTDFHESIVYTALQNMQSYKKGETSLTPVICWV